MNLAARTAASAVRPIILAEFEACLGRLYPRLMAHEARREVLSQFCRDLAALTGAILVTLGRSLPHGVITIEAQSNESLLWADLQRVPERWDDSFTGQGPGGRALRTSRPVLAESREEPLLTWRTALEREHVSQILCWPLRGAGDLFVLEILAGGPADPLLAGRSDLSAAVAALSRLLDEIAQLERQRLLADAMESAGNASFVTNLEGTIVWCNAAFCDISGYPKDQIVGNNPRFLKSGQQSLRYYRELWSTIRSGQVWRGETVDRDRDGRSYTIHQVVSPVAQDHRVTHFISIHTDISRGKEQVNRLERSQGSDPRTGLLTRAAFDAEAETALQRAAADQKAAAYVILSSQAVRERATRMSTDETDVIQASLAERLRGLVQAPTLACASQLGEFILLQPGLESGAASWDAAANQLAAALREPLPFVPDDLCQDLKIAIAHYPEDGESLTALRLSAERQLAHGPFKRARRELKH